MWYNVSLEAAPVFFWAVTTGKSRALGMFFRLTHLGFSAILWLWVERLTVGKMLGKALMELDRFLGDFEFSLVREYTALRTK